MTDTTKTKRAPKAPTVVPLTDPPATTVPAEHLIPAWRNAFLAASDNKHRTTLYRTEPAPGTGYGRGRQLHTEAHAALLAERTEVAP